MIIKDFHTMIEGNADAEALAADKPLSFWGGVDVATGQVLDIHHPLCGENVKGKVLCIPFDRGSCSGSGVMLETIFRKTNPAAILCVGAEAVLALGSVIGGIMYQRTIPIRTVSPEVLRKIETGDRVIFTEDSVIVEKRG